MTSVVSDLDFHFKERARRLALVGLWMLFLIIYLHLFDNPIAYNDIFIPDDPSSATHPALSPDSDLHVDVAQTDPDDSSKIRWDCIRRPRRDVADNDKSIPERLKTIRISSFYSVRFENHSPSMRDGRKPWRYFANASGFLAGFLGICIALMSFYIACAWKFPRAKEVLVKNMWMVTVLAVLVVIAAQAFLTYLEGGLLISPIGFCFSTVAGFLLAHAISTRKISTRWQQIVFYALPITLVVASWIANFFARRDFSDASLLLMSELFGQHYLILFFLATAIGVIAVFWRRDEPAATSSGNGLDQQKTVVK